MEWIQHHTMDHTLTFIHWLLIYLILLTLTILTQPPEQNSEVAAEHVLKNFANFTGKHLCWSLFPKLQAFRPATPLKTDSYIGNSGDCRGLRGLQLLPQILAKVELLPIDNLSEKKKRAEKYKSYQVPRKLLITLLLST